MRLEGVSVAIVLGAWESHVQGEGPQLAWYLKVRPSRMVRRGHPRQCREKGNESKSAQAAAVCGESRMHGDTGGDEETGREVPRLVPTHCGRGDSGAVQLGGPISGWW
jgi:hypothetical protein